MREVSFKQFAQLASRRGHTAATLTKLFVGKIEDPSEFFHDVMDNDHGTMVVPYRSVIEFYRQNCHFLNDLGPKHRLCSCGCGLAVLGRKKWARPGCRKRVQRLRESGTKAA